MNNPYTVYSGGRAKSVYCVHCIVQSAYVSYTQCIDTFSRVRAIRTQCIQFILEGLYNPYNIVYLVHSGLREKSGYWVHCILESAYFLTQYIDIFSNVRTISTQNTLRILKRVYNP